MANRTVIKLNNIPHGFYEKEMEKFFTQFGKVRNVLLVRSKKTHKSRGFGFIEFDLPQVAKAAAEAMHNYLFFNNVLKCRQMDKDDLPKKLFMTKYNGPTSLEKHKSKVNVSQRSEKNITAHYKKILKTQSILKKFGANIECYVINKPCLQ